MIDTPKKEKEGKKSRLCKKVSMQVAADRQSLANAFVSPFFVLNSPAGMFMNTHLQSQKKGASLTSTPMLGVSKISSRNKTNKNFGL